MTVAERPSVRCLIAKFECGDWRFRVVDSESVPLYLRSGWLNFCRDPFDLEQLRRWEKDERERRANQLSDDGA